MALAAPQEAHHSTTVNWAWSFRAFRLFGVDVRVHWSLPAVFLYYVVRGGQLGYSLSTVTLFVALPMALLFASVVAHEYGHVFAARHYALRIGHMVLTPIGGMVMVAQGRTPTHELVVALAGPLVNLALALAGVGLYVGIGGLPGIGLVVPFLDDGAFLQLWAQQRLLHLVVYDFVQAQMGLFLFNVLLMAYPMDGGRVLMSILWRRRGFHQALIASCKVARVLAVAMGLVGLITTRTSLAIIGALVFFQAHTTMSRAAMLPDPGSGYEQRAKAKPGFLKAWLLQRRRRKVRALVGRAEAEGLSSLSASEREWLKRQRNTR